MTGGPYRAPAGGFRAPVAPPRSPRVPLRHRAAVALARDGSLRAIVVTVAAVTFWTCSAAVVVAVEAHGWAARAFVFTAVGSLALAICAWAVVAPPDPPTRYV